RSAFPLVQLQSRAVAVFPSPTDPLPLAPPTPSDLAHPLGRARDLPARPVPASALEDALVIRRGIPVVALRERPTFTPPALAGLRAGTGVAVVAGCPVGRRRAGRIAHLIADRAM